MKTFTVAFMISFAAAYVIGVNLKDETIIFATPEGQVCGCMVDDAPPSIDQCDPERMDDILIEVTSC